MWNSETAFVVFLSQYTWPILSLILFVICHLQCRWKVVEKTSVAKMIRSINRGFPKHFRNFLNIQTNDSVFSFEKKSAAKISVLS